MIHFAFQAQFMIISMDLANLADCDQVKQIKVHVDMKNYHKILSSEKNDRKIVLYA